MTTKKDMAQALLDSPAWDGTNNNGRQVGSGLYFYRMETAEYEQTKRMTLLK